jgi:hypothetical protein
MAAAHAAGRDARLYGRRDARRHNRSVLTARTGRLQLIAMRQRRDRRELSLVSTRVWCY